MDPKDHQIWEREREKERPSRNITSKKKTLAENNNIVSLRRAVLLLCNANQEEEEEKTSDTHTDTKRHTHNQKNGHHHRPKNEMLAQLNLKTKLFPLKPHFNPRPPGSVSDAMQIWCWICAEDGSHWGWECVVEWSDGGSFAIDVTSAIFPV